MTWETFQEVTLNYCEKLKSRSEKKMKCLAPKRRAEVMVKCDKQISKLNEWRRQGMRTLF